jgi:hypothetical protein
MIVPVPVIMVLKLSVVMDSLYNKNTILKHYIDFQICNTIFKERKKSPLLCVFRIFDGITV